MEIDKFNISDSLNELWADAGRGKKISVLRTPIIGRESKIFTIGSCFALEIHAVLRQMGYRLFPDYSKLRLAEGKEVVGLLPEKSTLAYYTPASIYQELCKALECQDYQTADFYSIENPKNYFARKVSKDKVWQDPYRRDVYAADLTALKNLSERISAIVREGIREADVIVITLGLIEAWLNRANGLWVCRCPVRDNDPEWPHLELKILTASECYSFLDGLLKALFAKYPQKTVVLTVSPVPLGRTFSGDDMVVANTNSKATLRCVAGQILQEWKGKVFYWPSYEYALADDIFEEDGRHVRREEVEKIVSGFLSAFFLS